MLNPFIIKAHEAILCESVNEANELLAELFSLEFYWPNCTQCFIEYTSIEENKIIIMYIDLKKQDFKEVCFSILNKNASSIRNADNYIYYKDLI